MNGQNETRTETLEGYVVDQACLRKYPQDELLERAQAHLQYQILHYFRPSQRDRALPVQLGPLPGLRRLANRGEPTEPVTLLEHHPSFLAFQDAVQESLRTVEEVFIPQRFG
jgi:hypothetical protein